MKLQMIAWSVAFAAVAAWADGPTDPQIAAIVVTANQVDIDAGTFAKSHAHAADVQAFAERMVVDHGGVNASAVALVTRLGVTPAASATSSRLQQGGRDNLARLEKLQGAEFDRAYVEHEVSYHETVLGALDQTLVPNAQNAELKALLVKVRPAFVAHLEHARHLRAALTEVGGNDRGQ